MPPVCRLVLAVSFVISGNLLPLSAMYAQDAQSGRVSLNVKATDEDGDPLTFLWEQIDGPRVKIADPKSNETWFEPTEPGEYVFRITVSDGKTSSSKLLKRIVKMPNQPPLAKTAGEIKAIIGQRVLVDGSGSASSNGRIAEYRWSQLDGPKLKLDKTQLGQRQFYFEPPEPGSYRFALIVIDDKGVPSEPAQLLVKVAQINKPPLIEDLGDEGVVTLPLEQPRIVERKVDPGTLPVPVVGKGRVARVGEKIALDGSQSHDPQGERIEYFWTQEKTDKAPLVRTAVPDKSSAKVENASHFDCPIWHFTPPEPGEYSWVLELTAGKGEQARFARSEPVTFIVKSENSRPAAEIFLPETVFEVGRPVTLDGSRSSDPDNDKLEYIWGWSKDGLRPDNWRGQNGPQVQFTPTEPGEYGVQLIVSDGEKKSLPAVTRVIVKNANRHPTVSVPQSVEAVMGQTVRIEAIVEDPDQDPTELQWRVLDPKNFTLPETALKQNPLVFTPKEKRVYVFEAVASDRNSRSQPAVVQVAVTDQVNNPPTAIVSGPETATVGSEVTLSGEHSIDPEKKRLSYKWKQIVEDKDPTIDTPVPGLQEKEWRFKVNTPGIYRVALIVNDGVHDSPPHVWNLKVDGEFRPLAATIVAPQSAIAGENFTLTGTATGSGDSGEIRYRWKVLTETPGALLDAADKKVVQAQAEGAGTLRIELIVATTEQESAPAIVEIKVNPANAPPIASVTGPSVATINENIILKGSATDPDGDAIEKFRWTQILTGAPVMALSDEQRSLQDLVFNPNAPGEYEFALEVTDARQASGVPAIHRIKIIQTETLPVSILRLMTKPPYLTGREILISGEGSTEPSGGKLQFLWKQRSGPPLEIPEEGTTANQLRIIPTAIGAYSIGLTVKSGEQESVPTEVSFEVKQGNQPPIATIAPIPSVEPGERIILDASPSKDPEGKALEYRWSINSQPADAGLGFRFGGHKNEKVTLKLTKPGEYVFELKVFDGELWSETATATVKTRADNIPPVAIAAAVLGFTDDDLKLGKELLDLPYVKAIVSDKTTAPLFTETGREILLDGSASSDPDNGPKPLTYRWQRLSGERLLSEKPVGNRLRIVPEREGQMTWSLIVNDGKADSAPSTVAITVTKPGTLPAAVACVYEVKSGKQEDQRVLRSAASVRGGTQRVIVLDGADSYVGPNKQPIYRWKQIGGEDLGLPPSELRKSRVGLLIYHPGQYRFMLTVEDGEFASTPTLIEIFVSEARE